MSYLDFYPYQHSYPYPNLYPYHYHLRHLEKTKWERRFLNELAKQKRGTFRRKGASRNCDPLWRVTNPSLVLRGTTAWTTHTTPGSVAYDWVGGQASHISSHIIVRFRCAPKSRIAQTNQFFCSLIFFS